jgi:hypothetical protein
MARFGRTLAQLGLALLNATLLLALALALVVWQIVARVDSVVGRTVEVMETRLLQGPVGQTLARIEDRLQAIAEAGLSADAVPPGDDPAAARADLATLRADMAALRGALAEWRGQFGQGALLQAVAAAVLDELGGRLAPAPPG